MMSQARVLAGRVASRKGSGTLWLVLCADKPAQAGIKQTPTSMLSVARLQRYSSFATSAASAHHDIVGAPAPCGYRQTDILPEGKHGLAHMWGRV
jgi:hypothetical protein